jgi:hypothetical protein
LRQRSTVDRQSCRSRISRRSASRLRAGSRARPPARPRQHRQIDTGTEIPAGAAQNRDAHLGVASAQLKAVRSSCHIASFIAFERCGTVQPDLGDTLVQFDGNRRQFGEWRYARASPVLLSVPGRGEEKDRTALSGASRPGIRKR